MSNVCLTEEYLKASYLVFGYCAQFYNNIIIIIIIFKGVLFSRLVFLCYHKSLNVSAICINVRQRLAAFSRHKEGAVIGQNNSFYS